MKSVRNKFATREQKEHMVCVGDAFNPVKSYTKADFMSPSNVAEKFNISRDAAKKLMQKAKTYDESFVLNGHRAPIIVKLSKTSGLYLHPMAIDAFQKYLQKQRN